MSAKFASNRRKCPTFVHKCPFILGHVVIVSFVFIYILALNANIFCAARRALSLKRDVIILMHHVRLAPAPWNLSTDTWYLTTNTCFSSRARFHPKTPLPAIG